MENEGGEGIKELEKDGENEKEEGGLWEKGMKDEKE